MHALQRLEAIEGIKCLKARYFHSLDRRERDVYADVFGDEGVFDLRQFDKNGIQDGSVAPGPVLTGGHTICQFVFGALEGLQSAHRGLNAVIDIKSSDTAAAVWGMEDWIGGADIPFSLAGYGYYHDEYVRSGEIWRISRSILERWTVAP